ncbi:hypothetical protein B566_EDAN014557 [Ephemera danica]|nr:hypothetical protein B566_EDAN014557 [Ephemera danica]
MDIRNSVKTLERLNGCRVVEGYVQILLMDILEEDEAYLKNLSFPDLREITGYLLLYRVQGLRTLRNLFPNLAVIRGHTLFFNYALVIYEMRHLQEIGLVSLTHILRGSVRIEKNPLLCYVDTVDWDLIAQAGKEERFIAVSAAVATKFDRPHHMTRFVVITQLCVPPRRVILCLHT